MLTVTLKELKDFFRDPRSLILSFLLPLILFPLLFWVLNENRTLPAVQKRPLKIGITRELRETMGFSEALPIDWEVIEWPSTMAWHRHYDALLVNEPGADHPMIYYDNANSSSLMAFRTLETLLFPLPLAVVDQPDESEGHGWGRPLYTREEGEGLLFLGLFLPFAFVLFAVTCPLAAAADLSAGEKERGCLEPLLSTAASRLAIGTGKYLAALIIGCLSVASYGGGILLSVWINPAILGSNPMEFPLSPLQIGLLALLLIDMVALFTALELLAGFNTRSVREAQLLSMPLLMVGMGAVYLVQNIDPLERSGFYVHIPLVNLALAVGDILTNRLSTVDMAATFTWGALYPLILVALIHAMLERESLIGFGG